MCKWAKSGDNRIDPCMRDTVQEIQRKGIKTLGSCCGHGKYQRTVIIEKNGLHVEYFTGIVISRKRRFYKRDPQGIYYLPELENGMQKTIRKTTKNASKQGGV